MKLAEIASANDRSSNFLHDSIAILGYSLKSIGLYCVANSPGANLDREATQRGFCLNL